MQDRKILAMGSGLGAAGLVVFAILLGVGKRSSHDPVSYGSLFICWWAVALGFNMASTVCVSLLSKQLPSERNRWAGLVVQLSIWSGRTAGTVLGMSCCVKTYSSADIVQVVPE
jgi:MFS family permease